jgi:hypothetical protein
MSNVPTSERMTRILLLAFGMMLMLEVLATVRWWGTDGAEEIALGSDLRSFLTAGDMVAGGEAGSLYDLSAQLRWQQRRFPVVQSESSLLVFANPPFVASLFAPFGGRSTAEAYWTVLAINGVLLALSLSLLWILLDGMSPVTRLAFVAGAVSFLPVWTNLWQAQLSYPLLVGVLGAALAFRNRSDVAAGLCLSLLLVKPQLLLLPVLFLLLQRRARALAGVALGGLVIFGVGWRAGGFEALGEWAQLGRHLLDVGDAYGIHPRHMVTVRGAIHTTLGTNDFAAVRLPWVLITLGSVCALIGLWRRPLAQRAFELQLGGAIVAALLLSPHGYPHDLVVTIPAAVALSRAALESPTGRWAPFALGAVLLLWFVAWLAGDRLPHAANVPILVAVLGLLAWASHPEPAHRT